MENQVDNKPYLSNLIFSPVWKNANIKYDVKDDVVQFSRGGVAIVITHKELMIFGIKTILQMLDCLK